jgi:hypothetical protein
MYIHKFLTSQMHKLVTYKAIMAVKYDRNIRILNMLLVTDITCPYVCSSLSTACSVVYVSTWRL